MTPSNPKEAKERLSAYAEWLDTPAALDGNPYNGFGLHSGATKAADLRALIADHGRLETLVAALELITTGPLSYAAMRAQKEIAEAQLAAVRMAQPVAWVLRNADNGRLVFSKVSADEQLIRSRASQLSDNYCCYEAVPLYLAALTLTELKTHGRRDGEVEAWKEQYDKATARTARYARDTIAAEARLSALEEAITTARVQEESVGHPDPAARQASVILSWYGENALDRKNTASDALRALASTVPVQEEGKAGLPAIGSDAYRVFAKQVSVDAATRLADPNPGRTVSGEEREARCERIEQALADACCEARNSYVSHEHGGPDPDEHWAKVILEHIPDLCAPSCAPIRRRTIYCTASPQRMADMLVEAADALTPWMLDQTKEFPDLHCALPAILREEAERIRDRLPISNDDGVRS